MEGKKDEADKWIVKGKKVTKSWFKNLITGTDGKETAIECFTKAANIYKMIKGYAGAAEAYKLMVKPHMSMDDIYNAGNDWQNAANMYLKIEGNEAEAVECLTNAIAMYLENGKFSKAAKSETQLGDILETQEKFKEAISHYSKASTYFDNENLKSQGLDCDKKIAHLWAMLEDWDKSIAEFEKVGEYMANDKSLKWSAKEYHFKAILIHLCRAGKSLDEELENVKENFEKYKDKDVHFDNSDLAEFIQSIIESIQEENIKAFSMACKKNDDKLDNWVTKFCLKIKKNFERAMEDND